MNTGKVVAAIVLVAALTWLVGRYMAMVVEVAGQ